MCHLTSNLLLHYLAKVECINVEYIVLKCTITAQIHVLHSGLTINRTGPHRSTPDHTGPYWSTPDPRVPSPDPTEPGHIEL